MASATGQAGWQTVARRVRVPLGFATAVVFFTWARPRPALLAAGVPLIVAGLALRGYAAGFVRKNAELTRTGPYAHTRNPLYLGSILIAAGFAVAAGRVSLAVLLLGLFIAIYWPVILSEEAFLRETFPEFPAYVAAVPRLLPRPTAARFSAVTDGGAGQFSPARYRHHREYNALIGSAALFGALGLRMWMGRRSLAASPSPRGI